MWTNKWGLAQKGIEESSVFTEYIALIISSTRLTPHRPSYLSPYRNNDDDEDDDDDDDDDDGDDGDDDDDDDDDDDYDDDDNDDDDGDDDNDYLFNSNNDIPFLKEISLLNGN
ncbi:hypothetical protein PoB_007271000 [Plakobranchus ocellatus]|uniref:Uncharacterized protein n=1 Tax=Plakobranchus ocellatus TaxID=259542 RepID=A0AAV4DQI6_9GAST|nr:hypothetical protein PoB_007271000 [Plakobranchus ocellatus]